eukprot:gnl/TRDRNA2_/TRDRNA2_175148_c0_seq4.p1 gnl/TRDRNA2_/TRDRNA2_175148_c0~~gnl/TRDRNA2_/TRDRNA2_175148_c0_seq4.p1  ORF type:complete len:387 (+),score=51.46 gnl/TRDRNA2_/TRDRNA2_175148_c0_seq4:95-1255(+)
MAAAATRDVLLPHGSLYLWDDKSGSAVDDAASQLFSLCFLWQRAGEAITQKKLLKLDALLARQSDPFALTPAARCRQCFTAALLRAMLDNWYASDASPSHKAQHDSGIPRKLSKFLHMLQCTFVEPAQSEQEDWSWEWRHEHAAAFLQWLDSALSAAEQRALSVAPLRYVLLEYEHAHLISPGLWLEFGVGEGTSLSLIARSIPSHIAEGVVIGGGSRCFGFDCFVGLPEDWRPGFCAGRFARSGAQPPSFAPEIEMHIALVQGLFEDVLPEFLQQHPRLPVAVLHIDSDLYSAASFVLRTLIADHRIVPGTVIFFDELFHYCGFENHEALVLFELTLQCGLEYEWLGMQKGRMQAAIVVKSVRDPSAAAVSWMPARDMLCYVEQT